MLWLVSGEAKGERPFLSTMCGVVERKSAGWAKQGVT
jgi:hypothetical protein